MINRTLRRRSQARWVREWRKKNPELAKEMDKKKHIKYNDRRNRYSRLYFQEHKNDYDYKKKAKRRSYKYYRNNKLKAKCRSIFYKAVRAGLISKPYKCSICENTKNIHGHHTDYTQPFKVTWVCRSCHYKIHSGKLEIK